MLEAYKNRKVLDDLDAQLPDGVAQVMQALKGRLEGQPSDLPALLMLARCFVLSEEFDEAKNVLETLIYKDPGNVLKRYHINLIIKSIKV